MVFVYSFPFLENFWKMLEFFFCSSLVLKIYNKIIKLVNGGNVRLNRVKLAGNVKPLGLDVPYLKHFIFFITYGEPNKLECLSLASFSRKCVVSL
jgi:hypothetical protein